MIVNEKATLIIPRITCPALILAANRNDRVIGRMIQLNDSTLVRKVAIGVGAFSGSM